MKKKHLFLAATAITMMVSCADESYLGDQEALNAANGNPSGAISFTSGTPAITRSEGSTAASELGNKFKVYGVKLVGSTYSNVFSTEAYSTATDYNADPKAYWAWYATSTAGTTASNTKGWEYVGTGGSVISPALSAAQTIKYWDYSADQYEFVAYSATHTTGSGDEQTPKITKYQKNGFTVQATAADLAGLYVADKLTISTKNNTPTTPATGTNQIGNIVQFTFRSSGTKVRLGIYETISGYVVQNIKFRPNGSEFTATTENATLSGSFNGTSSSASGTYNVTYNASTGIAEFDNTAASANNYFEFGSLSYSATTEALGDGIGISSTAPTWAGGSSAYQGVLPNTDNVGNMILYVDYDLYNSKSGETIHVKGAKAVVPSMYMKWNPNYAYTYLFKISDNTNGTTGTEGTSPEGLYPITLDAVTIAATDGAQVGTITTISTPAITTYQNGSVSDAGITYANANGPIYITVNTNGTLANLTTTNTKLYTVDAGTTEADLMLTSKTKTASDLLSILSTSETIQGITFANGTSAKFTPANNTTYAVEYLVSAAVAESYPTASVSTGDELTANTYYERSGDSEPYTYTLTEDATAQDGKTYYTHTPAVPAVYQYKIIIVGTPT